MPPQTNAAAKGAGPFRLLFSPNGRLVAGVINPGHVHVFDRLTGQQVNVKNYLGEMAFHPDGRRLF